MRSITPLERDEMVSVMREQPGATPGALQPGGRAAWGSAGDGEGNPGTASFPYQIWSRRPITALMLAAIEYDGSEPWNELMTRWVKGKRGAGPEEQRDGGNQIEGDHGCQGQCASDRVPGAVKGAWQEATLEGAFR